MYSYAPCDPCSLQYTPIRLKNDNHISMTLYRNSVDVLLLLWHTIVDRKDYNKFYTCVQKCHLCVVKFIVQCNKVGSVEKKIIMNKEEGQCARHTHMYTQKSMEPSHNIV